MENGIEWHRGDFSQSWRLMDLQNAQIVVKIVPPDTHFFVTRDLLLLVPGCRQGVCQDHTHQGEIAKLLYFESNKGAKDELCSLDEYVSR